MFIQAIFAKKGIFLIFGNRETALLLDQTAEKSPFGFAPEAPAYVGAME
jgi:hypothetical protein